MNCGRCGTTNPPDDSFCEECGVALSMSASSGEGACMSCGAAPGTVDEQGFCESCGIRRVPRASSHTELAISESFAAVSDVGLRHYQNEDSFELKDCGSVQVIIVCDGVSSSQAAEQASHAAGVAACAALSAAIAAGNGMAAASMRSALEAAQASVQAIDHPSGSDADAPSTTIVAATVEGTRATIGWAGDSRAYWIVPAKSRRLTRDHSVLEDEGQQGPVAPENAHAITRWIGADAGDDFAASISEVTLEGEGWLFLCSDGLWNYANEIETVERLVLDAPGDALTRARALVQFAIEQGGRDNITAALLRIGHESGKTAVEGQTK